MKTFNEQMIALVTNLAYNWTWLANPEEKRGVIFKYDPEAPVLDKSGKPTGKTFGKLTTTIKFSDGTTCTCSNSSLDRVGSKMVSEIDGVKLAKPVLTADDAAKEAGIVNCIFKRMIGAIKPDGTVDGTGGARWLKKQVENAYDQNIMDIYYASKKKLEAATNAAKHEAIAKKAHDRKVKKMAKQMVLKKEAEALLEAKKCAAAKTSSGKCKPLNESAPKKTCTCGCSFPKSDDEWVKIYTRPNKPFSQFTQEEKREYWKAQKRGLL